MHHAGRIVSRTEIVEHLYDQDFDRDSNTIEVFVGRLAQEARRRRHPDACAGSAISSAAGRRKSAPSRARIGRMSVAAARRASMFKALNAQSIAVAPVSVGGVLELRRSSLVAGLGFRRSMRARPKPPSTTARASICKALVADIASRRRDSQRTPASRRSAIRTGAVRAGIGRSRGSIRRTARHQGSRSLFAAQLPRLDADAARVPSAGGVAQRLCHRPRRAPPAHHRTRDRRRRRRPLPRAGRRRC